MVNTGIILARNTERTLAPLERPCAPLARQKRRNLPQTTASAASIAPENTLPHLDLHFIYTLCHENGRPGAKRALQATDDYWSCQCDRMA